MNRRRQARRQGRGIIRRLTGAGARRAAALLAAAGLAGLAATTAQADQALPNVVLIFTDDQGYGDVGCYGAQGFETPHLDRLAAEGRRFTSFYVPQAVCSASRAALLTGCYPNRIGILGALSPMATIGIHDDETTLGEVFGSRGYATAAIGKWHLGHHPRFLPVRHGFDEYFGLPYSNDMRPSPQRKGFYPDLPLIDGSATIELNPDQSQLTTRYTQRAVQFIEAQHERPFLLYVAHSMPHVPLYVSDKHRGASAQGLYGDVIEEIDWSVGQILAALDRHELAERTLVIFTTDNGPWLSYGNHGGSAGPLREGKGTSWEGGVRVPCIMRWPGQIPAGSLCHEPLMTIDLLPTLAGRIGAALPADPPRDGLDVWPLVAGQADAASPHEVYWFYWGQELQAVRSGRWKLHFPHAYRTLKGEAGRDGAPGPYVQAQTPLALFDLETDPGETTDVASAHPEVVERLARLAEIARGQLGDSARGQQGAGQREPGKI